MLLTAEIALNIFVVLYVSGAFAVLYVQSKSVIFNERSGFSLWFLMSNEFPTASFFNWEFLLSA